jgi:hypothetical protein
MGERRPGEAMAAMGEEDGRDGEGRVVWGSVGIGLRILSHVGLSPANQMATRGPLGGVRKEENCPAGARDVPYVDAL